MSLIAFECACVQNRSVRARFSLALGRHAVSPKARSNSPGEPTLSGTLDLQPGELIRVKSHEEILKTVDSSNRNRGMYWDAELVSYCGGTYRVLKRVSRLIDEKTGKMIEMKNSCIVLD
jgi:hypothetical protein